MCTFRAMFLSGLVSIGNCINGMDRVPIEPIDQLARAITFHSNSLCTTIMAKNPGIENLFSLNYHVSDGYFPLHIAVAEDNMMAVQQFLPLSNSHTSQTLIAHNSALHLVRTKEMAKKLKKSGLDVMSRNAQGETPLLHILFDTHGYGKKGLVNDNEKYSIVHYLLKHDADLINAAVDAQGNTLFHVAATKNNCELTQFLLEHNANPEICNVQGESPVAIAMKNWCFCVLLELRKVGIFVMSDESYQRNIFRPLQNDAAHLRNLIWNEGTDCYALCPIAELCIYLNQHKTDGAQKPELCAYSIERKDGLWHCFKNASITHLEELVGTSSVEFAQKSLQSVCIDALHEINSHITPNRAALNHYEPEHVKSHNRRIKYFIETHPFVLHYDKKIVFDMLSSTIIGDDAEMLEFLLSKKPDVRCTDTNGNTLLHVAMVYKNATAVELLVKNGADIKYSDTAELIK